MSSSLELPIVIPREVVIPGLHVPIVIGVSVPLSFRVIISTSCLSPYEYNDCTSCIFEFEALYPPKALSTASKLSIIDTVFPLYVKSVSLRSPLLVFSVPAATTESPAAAFTSAFSSSSATPSDDITLFSTSVICNFCSSLSTFTSLLVAKHTPTATHAIIDAVVIKKAGLL